MLLFCLLSVDAAAADRQWVFDVYLEDDPIGQQTFRISEEQGEKRVLIEASLDVKVLFFTVYSYRHRNEERWRDGCLTQISSTTDDNGDDFRLNGRVRGDAFVVETAEDTDQLSGCVRSFAYWNPDHLRASKLLNSQTGEYEPVTFRLVGEDTVTVIGSPRQAKRYALESETFRIDLWYSPDDEWLGLESKSKGGRTLRYVLAN
jgi:hypothetical protein